MLSESIKGSLPLTLNYAAFQQNEWFEKKPKKILLPVYPHSFLRCNCIVLLYYTHTHKHELIPVHIPAKTRCVVNLKCKVTSLFE